MSNLNQIQDMTQKYWEGYSLGFYIVLSQSAVNNINKRKLTSWFKTLLITATKNMNLFGSWTNFNEREATHHQHHLRTQTQHKSLCYLGYLGYLRNCESRSEMQDIRLFSRAHQTWSLSWHHTTNLNYHPSANLVFIWLLVGVERNMLGRLH